MACPHANPIPPRSAQSCLTQTGATGAEEGAAEVSARRSLSCRGEGTAHGRHQVFRHDGLQQIFDEHVLGGNALPIASGDRHEAWWLGQRGQGRGDREALAVDAEVHDDQIDLHGPYALKRLVGIPHDHGEAGGFKRGVKVRARVLVILDEQDGGRRGRRHQLDQRAWTIAHRSNSAFTVGISPCARVTSTAQTTRWRRSQGSCHAAGDMARSYAWLPLASNGGASASASPPTSRPGGRGGEVPLWRRRDGRRPSAWHKVPKTFTAAVVSVSHSLCGVTRYTYEAWLHVPTNDLWAVALDKDAVVMVCGPVDPREVVSDLLPYLPYRVYDAAWIQQHRAAFRRVCLEDQHG
jgi:hypothetical protein